jgi:hypothetical protein
MPLWGMGFTIPLWGMGFKYHCGARGSNTIVRRGVRPSNLSIMLIVGHRGHNAIVGHGVHNTIVRQGFKMTLWDTGFKIPFWGMALWGMGFTIPFWGTGFNMTLWGTGFRIVPPEDSQNRLFAFARFQNRSLVSRRTGHLVHNTIVGHGVHKVAS